MSDEQPMANQEQHIPILTTPRVDNLPHRALKTVSAAGAGHTFEDAIARAQLELAFKARQDGGDAVVSLTMNAVRAEEGLAPYRVMLLGTLVKLPWPDGSASPEIYSDRGSAQNDN